MKNHQTSSAQRVSQKAPKEFPAVRQVRELVLTYGWNSTSYQIINPGIRRWFSETSEAVVGFVSCSGRRIVAGAPVCSKESLKKVADEFERDAAQKGERVCYFCAETRLEAIYADSPNHAKILLSAQPIWHPADWTEIIATHKSLRAQLNRARNKNVKVSELVLNGLWRAFFTEIKWLKQKSGFSNPRSQSRL